MENYRTEEEQVEALKRWWRENGRSTVVAVGLAVAAGLGWQAWQRNEQAAKEGAALRFQAFIEAVDAQATGDGPQLNDPRELGELLREEEGNGSVYGQMTALHLARLAVLDDDLELAEEQLRWVLYGARGAVAEVARLRLARVLTARDNTDEALRLLEASGDSGFAAAYAIARGDALLNAGRDDDALAAYREAEAMLAAGATLPPGLRDKLDYLSTRTPAADSAAPEMTDPSVEPG